MLIKVFDWTFFPQIPLNVGEVLPGRECHRVHGGRRGPRQDRGQQERAAQPPGPAPAGGNTHTGAGQQEGSSGCVRERWEHLS